VRQPVLKVAVDAAVRRPVPADAAAHLKADSAAAP
jgi:hypothetical protein